MPAASSCSATLSLLGALPIAFRPETLFVTGTDSTFTGRALTGYDVMNSERDEITRSFAAASDDVGLPSEDRKSTRLNSSHRQTSYAVFCLKKKTQPHQCKLSR